MHVAEFRVCFIELVTQPGSSNLKGSTKDVHIPGNLRAIAQSDSSNASVVHHDAVYVRVISNLDPQRFELTYLRIDEKRLQVARQYGQEWTGLPHPIAADTLRGHSAELIDRNGGRFENIL